MEIFDSLNLYLMNHPAMLAQLEFVFRIRYWIFLALALFFITLPHREQRKKKAKDAKKDDNFIA